MLDNGWQDTSFRGQHASDGFPSAQDPRLFSIVMFPILWGGHFVGSGGV